MPETETQTETQTETTETTVELPDYLNEPDYEEILVDDKSKNILSRYKTPQELAKAVIEKETLVRSGFKLPKKLGTEQITEITQRLAEINKVPEKPEGYNLVRPEEVGEDNDFSEQFKMEMRAFAKEKNLSPETFQGLYEKSLRAIKAAKDNAKKEFANRCEQENEKTVAHMQSYWGTEEYKRVAGDNGLIERFSKSRAMDESEYDELIERLDNTGMKNNRLLFKLIGDGARAIDIMEGTARTGTEFQQTQGNRKLTEEALAAQKWPETPKSLGGGKPG